MRVGHTGRTHRAQQQAAEAAMAPPPDYEHVSIPARVNEGIPWASLHQLGFDVRRCFRPERLGHCFLEDLPGPHVEVVDSHGHVAVVHGRVIPACHRDELCSKLVRKPVSLFQGLH
ncbi:hypothetical protein D9M69_719350 [compost metagenome]